MNVCFQCKSELADNVCPNCGLERTFSPDGNIMWWRGGRVIAVPQEEKEAWVRMAKRSGIPEEDWPEKYRDKEA
jgi:hypothetical protein